MNALASAANQAPNETIGDEFSIARTELHRGLREHYPWTSRPGSTSRASECAGWGRSPFFRHRTQPAVAELHSHSAQGFIFGTPKRNRICL